MSTLAHELGHGYHNMNLAARTMLQRSTPMTLAETASIFCETIVREAALRDADAEERIDDSRGVVGRTVPGGGGHHQPFSLRAGRLRATRRTRELSVDELNAMMLQAQRDTYGDGLDRDQLHPYMWAMKAHYYSTGRSFYNFPYMFGLLFGLGLYARYRQDPEPSASNTMICSPQPDWPTRQLWRPASASTHARPTSGARAWRPSRARWINSRRRLERGRLVLTPMVISAPTLKGRGRSPYFVKRYTS